MFIAGCAFFMAFFASALWLINREIKFREISQKNLQVEEHRLFQYLEAVPLGIFVADKDGKPYYANQRAREILGRGLVAEASSQTLSQVYQAYRAGTQEIYPSNQTPMGLALQGKKTTLEDLDIHRPDGTVVPPADLGGRPSSTRPAGSNTP